jgi:hypothetical protein
VANARDAAISSTSPGRYPDPVPASGYELPDDLAPVRRPGPGNVITLSTREDEDNAHTPADMVADQALMIAIYGRAELGDLCLPKRVFFGGQQASWFRQRRMGARFVGALVSPRVLMSPAAR